MIARFASPIVFGSLLFTLTACGGAKPNAKAPSVDVSPTGGGASTARGPVRRPDDIGLWIHAGDAAAWGQIGAGILEDPDKSHEIGLFALAEKILAPKTPFDLTIGGDAKHTVSAFSFTAKDVAETWRALESRYTVKQDGKTVSLSPKKQKKTNTPGDDDEDTTSASAKSDDEAYWCTTSGAKIVCTTSQTPPEGLVTWLRSNPVPEGTTGSDITVDLYGGPLREEALAEIMKTPFADKMDLVETFEHGRVLLTNTGDKVKATLSVEFRPDPRQKALFTLDERKARSSRVLAAWPSDATLSLASPGWPALQRLFGQDEAEIKALNRFFAAGVVVDKSDVDGAMKAYENAKDEKAFAANKEKLSRAIEGYTLVGLAETDDLGGKLSLKDVLALDRVKKLGKPRPAKGAPAGAIYIAKKTEKSATASGAKPKAEEGTLVFNDGKGAIWILDGNSEAVLAAAAKRIAATKEASANGWAFDANTRAIGKWSTAFGSFWTIDLAASMLTFDSVKGGRASGTSVFSLMKKELHTDDAIATIPVTLRTTANPPRLELALEGSPATWRNGIRNASGPIAALFLGFAALAGGGSLAK